MRTVISNRIYVYNASIDLLFWAQDNLIVVNPTWQQMKKMGKDDLILFKHIPEKMKLYIENGPDLILPFGCLYAVWSFIKKYPYELKFNDNGQVINKNMKISMPLFDYQEEAVEKMLFAKGGILEAAAGSGKTNIGIEISKRIGKNTLWLCHTQDLLNQTVNRIHLLYPNLPVGTITDGSVNMVKNGITVSTIQTLVTVDPDIYKDAFDVVITDEAHHVNGSPTLRKMFVKVIEKIPARYKYGLSATPERTDTMIKTMYTTIGCDLEGNFKPTFTIAKSKTNTLIAKHIRFDLDTEWDYSCLNEDGTFNYAALVDFLGHNQKRNEVIVNNIIKTLETHKKQLVLCQRIDQCETINEMLKNKGIKSVILVGKVTKKKRKEILEGEKDWNVIVATLSLAKEGLDYPELSCLHWAMVISDKVATIQSAGRIERVFEGKPEPEIYDYVDKNYPYCLGKYKKRVTFLRKR